MLFSASIASRLENFGFEFGTATPVAIVDQDRGACACATPFRFLDLFPLPSLRGCGLGPTLGTSTSDGGPGWRPVTQRRVHIRGRGWSYDIYQHETNTSHTSGDAERAVQRSAAALLSGSVRVQNFPLPAASAAAVAAEHSKNVRSGIWKESFRCTLAN